jgi:spore maturation protein CgeB
MQILYVAMRHEYGDPGRGLSFEEMNFRSALESMGHELTTFDFMAREMDVGVEAMRSELIELAGRVQPDLAFFFLFTYELDPATIEAVGQRGGCPTVNWFADDHFRFETYTRHVAAAFDLSVTTDPESVAKYSELDGTRVLLSQWACNPHVYGKAGDGLRHEITFVGQTHGDRKAIIGRLSRAGHPVECWGFGWPRGPIAHEGMIEVFSTSRINLNLNNSPEFHGRKVRLRKRLHLPARTERPKQIKGRNFEVPGCGGFLLTERVPHLERYFVLGEEIGVYEDLDDLLVQLPHWLEDEGRRAKVAEAGYRRVLREHTYDRRFTEIFDALDLPSA